jgi:hypothetical protein
MTGLSPRTLMIVGLVAAGASGCGGGSGPTPVAVAGRVETGAGQPCGGALVVFHPRDTARLNDAKPVAIAASDGSFQATTTRQHDGAVPGEYGVTVVWPDPTKRKQQLSLSSEGGSSGPDRLKGRYGNPGRPRITVTIPPAGDRALTLVVDEG